MATILPSVRTMFLGMTLFCCASTAFAQTAATSAISTSHQEIAAVPVSDPYGSLFVNSPIAAVDQPAPATRASLAMAAAQVPSAPIQSRPEVKQTPRGLLPALYAGNIALQVMDTHSTFRALDAGLVESNPMMRWTTDHPVAFVSMKAAATATTILVAEKIRKKYPRRAALFMAGVNTAYAFVVLHNYRVTN
jgi:uncharacterized protein DUF5658